VCSSDLFAGISIEVGEEAICPDPTDPESGINKARRSGNERGFYNPGQYDNEANPRAHERWTGKKIWDQLEGEIDIFCAGLGTTGTMVGTSRYLKSKDNRIRSVGVTRSPNNPVPGVRTQGLLKEISLDWGKAIDAQVEVSTSEAFLYSLKMCREGLLAGPSAGFALAGAIEFLSSEIQEHGGLTHLSSNGESLKVVIIAPDGPLPYIEEYFLYLDSKYFPEIINSHLLSSPSVRHDTQIQFPGKQEIEAISLKAGTVVRQTYSVSGQEAFNEDSVPESSWFILDVRSSSAFTDHHLPGSLNISIDALNKILVQYPATFAERKVLIVCEFGVQSVALAISAQEKGIEAYSLHGGTREWSHLNLPRVVPISCRKDSKASNNLMHNHVQ
jgi:cysteine synthase A